MASLVIDSGKILENIEMLDKFLKDYQVEWSLIMKVLSGNKSILEKILTHLELKNMESIGDSRISSLRMIKSIKPDAVTMYIKPPALDQIKNVIRYADVSLNSSQNTIKALNDEAGKQGKIHKVIVMIEMGELREGVIRDQILEFYQNVFSLPNIEIIGIGTNLGCMYGIEPNYDKLIQLCLYKQLLEVSFKKKIKYASGGSSITLPLVGKGKRPEGINHFRIGEAAFFGTSPFDNKRFRRLHTDAFTFYGNIIELAQKQVVPDGQISEASIGHTASFDDFKETDLKYRAILDFGLLDTDVDDLKPRDKNVHFAGTTSDMTVYEIGDNKTKSGKTKYRVGDKIEFHPNYMGVARLMSSKFTDKKII